MTHVHWQKILDFEMLVGAFTLLFWWHICLLGRSGPFWPFQYLENGKSYDKSVGILQTEIYMKTLMENTSKREFYAKHMKIEIGWKINVQHTKKYPSWHFGAFCLETGGVIILFKAKCHCDKINGRGYNLHLQSKPLFKAKCPWIKINGRGYNPQLQSKPLFNFIIRLQNVCHRLKIDFHHHPKKIDLIAFICSYFINTYQ